MLHPDVVGPQAADAIELARSTGAVAWKVNGAGGDGGSLAVLHESSQARAVFHSAVGGVRPLAGAGASVLGRRPCRRGQPSRKLNRTVRRALSRLVSSRQTDCQVPSCILPATTGTVSDGETNAGSTWSRPCPSEPWRWRQPAPGGRIESTAARRSSSLAAPTSMTAIPAVAWGTKTFGARQRGRPMTGSPRSAALGRRQPARIRS